MSLIDLHCHSTRSDGLLAPAEVVRHAAARGVKVLALTDHDETGGLAEARAAAQECGVTLVNGVEISVTRNNQTLHVLGLGIDPEHAGLAQGLAGIRASRRARAERMAVALEKAGIRGSLEGAYAHASNPDMVGRTHFARFLVASGVVKDVRSVFKKYLVSGKPGYVSHQWAGLADAIGWIIAAGGMAVLAHPGRYKMNAKQMRLLLREFKGLGGTGIEVVSGSHTVEHVAIFARYARELDLRASGGSDYHGPGESYMDLGGFAALPPGCTPLWHDWDVMRAVL
ncbi:MAG: 3',5'-nucleoside bisphosphate phosphatase [Pseudomonadota bacterium]